MKSRLFSIITICLFMTLKLIAQNQIVVQNGSNFSSYYTLSNAVEAAENGDSIYIPGGIWPTDNLCINKQIHIFGNGYHPDSSGITGFTRLSGNLSLADLASNGSISGIYLDGSILRCSASDSIFNFKVTRNFIAGEFRITDHFNGFIIENIFNSPVTTADGTYFIYSTAFYNNFFNSYLFIKGYNCTIENNIFLSDGPVIIKIDNSNIENNIFISSSNTINSDVGINGSVYINNNLFVENWNQNDCNCIGNENIINQDQSTIFLNQIGNAYNFLHDYHLDPSSPGNNAGTDGSDVGNYGGIFSWKDGSLPENPHIILKQISGSSDPNGNLQINVKVKAQNN